MKELFELSKNMSEVIEGVGRCNIVAYIMCFNYQHVNRT